MKTIDLRSDTVTRPTEAMRQAMARAEVGDDVLGDDPTVIELQELAADMLGAEASIFASSGTQANLMALLSHCERGDEYIVGQEAHTYVHEGGGGAVFGSIQPQPLDLKPDGTLDLEKVVASIKPPDHHYANTRLLCLENTQSGKVLPLDYMENASAVARKHGLSIHLDGARVFNAAVELGVPLTDITRHFDSVSICLSKGLGAPVGSLLCGSAEFINRAHRWRKVLGGGMRQVGILAAAGIVALTDHIERLAEDHENARVLAEGLNEVDEIEVQPFYPATNMVFSRMLAGKPQELGAHLEKNGILTLAAWTTRYVTHLDVNRDDMLRVVDCIKEYFAGL